MGSHGTGLLIIMLVIDLMLFVNGYLPVPAVADHWDITTNLTSGEIEYNESNLHGVTTENTGILGSLIQNVYSTIGFVWDWVLFIFEFVFAPLTTMIQLGAPLVLKLGVGVTWSVMFFVMVVSFIRGTDF